MYDRLAKGDESAAPEFRKFLKGDPEYVDTFGNMARDAERALIKKATGENLVIREIYAAKLAALRAELAGPQPNAIERLLVERVVACWFQVNHADGIAAWTEQCTLEQGDYHQRRQDRAHKRFLSAVKMLATIRRLALPIRVDVNVAGTVETKNATPAVTSERFRLPATMRN
jgi:hypothetical protein